jgi:conflict system STAND superfamily ATPase
MLRLTQLGEGTEDTRRRAAINELWTWPEEQPAVEQVIEELADARLLTTSLDASGERQVDVAHEALIRDWPRLRRWIEEDPTALRTHRRITEATQEWRRMQRDESVLFRGVRLAQAQEWREQHENDLNDLERKFLDASITQQVQEAVAAQERQRRELEQVQALAAAQQQRAEEQARATRHLRRRAVGLAAVALLAVAVAVVAWRQQQAAYTNEQLAIGRLAESNRFRRISLAQVLVTQALHQHNQLRDERSALLARHAYLFNQQYSGHVLDQVDDALRTVLSGLYFSHILPHKGLVISVAFSPDGQWLAVGDIAGNGSVWLWNLPQPEAPPTILPNLGGNGSVAFSADGQ